MGLKFVHIIFIIASILITLGFAIWTFVADTSAFDDGVKIFGIVSGVIGVALLGYFFWFLKKSKNLKS